jgi:hypothetical protein
LVPQLPVNVRATLGATAHTSLGTAAAAAVPDGDIGAAASVPSPPAPTTVRAAAARHHRLLPAVDVDVVRAGVFMSRSVLRWLVPVTWSGVTPP